VKTENHRKRAVTERLQGVTPLDQPRPTGRQERRQRTADQLFLMLVIVGFVLVPGVIMVMRRRCVRLVVVAMGAAVTTMGMVMIVLEGVRVAVVVLVTMGMFFFAMFVAVLVLMLVVVGMGVAVGVFALAHRNSPWKGVVVGVALHHRMHGSEHPQGGRSNLGQ